MLLAFFSSSFKSSLVFTQDGKGDSSGAVFKGNSYGIEELARQSQLDSIGQICIRHPIFRFYSNRHRESNRFSSIRKP